jgi:hypothetical protein
MAVIEVNLLDPIADRLLGKFEFRCEIVQTATRTCELDDLLPDSGG